MSHIRQPNKPLYAPVFEAFCQVVVCCNLGLRLPVNKLATRRIVDDSTGLAITFFNDAHPDQCLAVVTGWQNQSKEFRGDHELVLARSIAYVMQHRILNQTRLNATLSPRTNSQEEAVA